MTKNKNIPDLYLEKYIQGLLNSEDAVRISKLVEGDDELMRRINEIQLSNTEFLSNPKFTEGLINIERGVNAKLTYKKSNHVSNWRFAGAGLAVCILIFTFLPNAGLLFTGDVEIIYSEPGSEIRLKGILPELSVYRKQKDYVEKIADNQYVSNHDILQLRYRGAGYQYGVIFSIDGRGEITLHFPDDVNGNTRIQPEGNVALPYAYELDDAPYFERFFLLVSHESLDVDEILKKGKALARNKDSITDARLEIQDGVYQSSVVVSKEK